MPETLIAPAPATPAPTPSPATAPAPAPSPTPTPSTPAAPQTPADKASAAIRTVLDGGKAKTPIAKPDASKPEPEDDEKPIKSNAGAWRVYEAKKKAWTAEKTTWQTEKQGLEKQLSELKSQPRTQENVEEQKKVREELESYRTQIADHKKQISELSYERSDDFRRDFQQPFEDAHASAIAKVKNLQVQNEDGETQRPATAADFDLIRSLPIQNRRAMARKLFGDASDDVMDDVKELERIKSNAKLAIQRHGETRQQAAQEDERKRGDETRQHQTWREAADKQIRDGFPEYFNPDHYNDHPELKKALEDGYAYVDGSMKDMDPSDRIATAATMRAKVAGFHLLQSQVPGLREKITALETELTKYRGSDPGNGGAAPTPSEAPKEEVGSIAEMTQKFNSLPR